MRIDAKPREEQRREWSSAAVLPFGSMPEPEKTAAASQMQRAGIQSTSSGGSYYGGKTQGAATLDARLAELQELDLAGLREEWRCLLGGEALRLSRDLSLRAVAYALQELTLGGLAPSAGRQLEPSTGSSAQEARITRPARPLLQSGARLVREWRGRTHTIEVLEAGFVFDDKTFRSLSEIARRITGAHWSGPRFFGLTKKRAVATATANDASPGPALGDLEGVKATGGIIEVESDERFEAAEVAADADA